MIDRRQFLKTSGAALISTPMVACAGIDKSPNADVPRSRFGPDSTAEEVTRGIDLAGKLAVVTGCTSGIGLETMRVLSLRGAHVVGTSRSLQKAKEACRRMPGVTTPLSLELGEPESVLACADAIDAVGRPLDILICNAGYLGGTGQPELVNGIEKHFAINHLGHFLLVNRLLRPMHASAQGRVVVVGSRAGYTSAPRAGIEFDNLDGARDYEDRRAYGHSKLANALFSLHLARRLSGTQITSNALHPGVINTEIDRHLNRFLQVGFGIATRLGYGKSIEEGAATTCYVATSPNLAAISGHYFEDCNAVMIGSDKHVHDEAMAERLWEVSEALMKPFLGDIEQIS
jgi:NAD(P)-dependent dehydrogenase (short-subunit alcohol dehydrogenase family)